MFTRLPSQPLSAVGRIGRLQPRTQTNPIVMFHDSSSMELNGVVAEALGIT